MPTGRPITIFTPSFADESNTNAQNLTVKEIVARLPQDRFHVSMIVDGPPDSRIARRKNTRLLQWRRYGNAVRLAAHCLFPLADIYFYPRSGPLDRMFLDLRRTLRLRTKVVTHVVMMMNETTGVGLMARSILEADAVFGNSTYVAETVYQRFGVKAGTIHNGVDRRCYFSANERNPTSPRQALTVLYAGSFQARKRVEMIIRLAARRPDAHFLLAGRGETETACRALAQQLGCGNVVFLGHLTPAQLGEEMRKADVFLFPSVLEGHPQVLAQAAACGLPSIAMKVYQPDAIINSVTGFLVESEEEAGHKLDLLLDGPDLRCSMSLAAIEHSKQFDWEGTVAQWQRVFEAVVSGNRAP